MKAWLVTWESVGDHAAVNQPIASILSPRLGPNSVLDHVERLYADSCLSLPERLDVARNRRLNPDPAEFDRIEGMAIKGRIHCGHNPFLLARMVTHLEVTVGEDGEERLTWRELPRRPNQRV